MLDRLADSLPDDVSQSLVHSVATFPEDGLTFEALLNHCEQNQHLLLDAQGVPTRAARRSPGRSTDSCDNRTSIGHTNTRLTG